MNKQENKLSVLVQLHETIPVVEAVFNGSAVTLELYESIINVLKSAMPEIWEDIFIAFVEDDHKKLKVGIGMEKYIENWLISHNQGVIEKLMTKDDTLSPSLKKPDNELTYQMSCGNCGQWSYVFVDHYRELKEKNEDFFCGICRASKSFTDYSEAMSAVTDSLAETPPHHQKESIPCPGIWLGDGYSGCTAFSDPNGPDDCPTCNGTGVVVAYPYMKVDEKPISSHQLLSVINDYVKEIGKRLPYTYEAQILQTIKELMQSARLDPKVVAREVNTILYKEETDES